MAEPFDSIALALADIIDRRVTGAINEATMATEIAPLLVDLAPTEWEQLIKVVQVLGRVKDLLLVTGAPSADLGLIGASALDVTNKMFYGPKTGAGWGAGVSVGAAVFGAGVDAKAKYGMTALNDASDQAKIVTALADLPVSSEVTFPQGAGAYKLTSTLAITRAMDFRLEPNATFRLDVPGTDTTSPIMSVNINELPDAIDVPGQTVRGMVMEGGRVFSYNTTALTALTAGSYGLSINDDPAGPLTASNPTGSYYSHIGLRHVNMSLGGRLGALYYGGKAGQDSIFFSGPEDCDLENGWVMEEVSDGMRSENCRFFGTLRGIQLNARAGAYNHYFRGGTCSSRDGYAYIINADRFLIDNVQIEHGLTYAGVPSSLTHNAYIWIEGRDRKAIGGRVKGSNLGSTNDKDAGLAVGNTDSLLVDEMYFGLTAEHDLLFTNKNATNTIWGLNNAFRAARTRQPIAGYTMTDPSRLLRVGFTGPNPTPLSVDNANTFTLQGVYNLWINAADVLTGGTAFEGAPGGPNNMEFMVERTGRVGFQGVWQGGTDQDLVADTAIFTTPAWFRPFQNAKMVVSINDTPHILTVLPNGEVYSELGLPCPSGQSLRIEMSPAFFYAVTNVPYEEGVA